MLRRLCVLLALLALSSVGATAAALELSQAERDWLKAHRELTVATFEKGWAPFEFMEDQHLKGYAPELLGRMAAKLGVGIVPKVYPTWSEALEAACQGEVDVLMNTAMVSGRTSCLVFTPPYMDVSPAIVGRPESRHLNNAGALSTARIAVERDFAMDVVLAERFPQGKRIVVEGTREALQAVKDGRADAYVGNPYVAMSLMREPALSGLALIGPADFPTDTLHFAIPDDRKQLASALRKALVATKAQDTADIRAKWLGPDLQWGYRAEGVTLTTAERTYLANLPVLDVAFDRDWDPVSIQGDDGLLAGISGDYLALIEKRLGVRLNTRHDTTRSGLVDMLRHQAVEIAPVAKGTYLGDAWRMTVPFARLPNVIATRDDRSFIGVDDLNGRSVAVLAGHRAQLVGSLASQARVTEVHSLDEALQGVSNGRFDAFIGDIFSIDKAIRTGNHSSIRISGPAGFDDEMVFAVAARHEALVPLIDRVISHVDEVEERTIRSTWTTVDYEYGVPWQKVLLAGTFASGLLLVVGVAYYRTSREIRAREASDRLLGEVTRTLPCVVFQGQLTPAGGLSLLYIAGNAKELLGIDSEEFLKNSSELIEVIDPTDRARFQDAISISARDVTPVEIEVRRDEPGMPRWICIEGIPMRGAEGGIYWTGYVADVTEKRIRLDALAVAKESAEAAAKAKSHFLSIMSHEIRTPMGGILGFVELLDMTSLDGEQKRLLSLIQESSRSLRTILDDILDYSKIEAGELRLEMRPMDLRSLVCNSVALAAEEARKKGLLMTCDLDPLLAGRVLGDETRIRQVLVNFLSNAIKFTNVGRVDVRVDVLEMTPGVQKWHLSVTDSGIGMSSDQRERVFQPFAQAEASTSRRYGGTGLGLTICRQLGALMGGAITLATEPGMGTRVGLELQTEVVRLDASEPTLAGRSFRIDCRDDALRYRIEAILQTLGMVGTGLDRSPEILIVDSESAEATEGAAVIELVRERLNTRHEKDRILLSVLPLLHTSVQQACLQAVRSLPPTSSGEHRVPVRAGSKNARILVAEDNLVGRILIASQLDELGYTSCVVSDGKEALDHLGENTFDLLITDIQMPGLDGYQLVAELRRLESAKATRRLPVVAMTAGALSEDIERCLAAGMDDYVAKPVQIASLARLLQRWLPREACSD